LVGCGDALDADAFGSGETVGPEAAERAGPIGAGADLPGLADGGLEVGDVGPLSEGLGLSAQVGGAMGAEFGDGVAALGQFGAGFDPVELVGCGLVDIAPDGGIPGVGAVLWDEAGGCERVGAVAIGEEAEQDASALEGPEGGRVAGDGGGGAGKALVAGESEPGGVGGGRIGIGGGEPGAQALVGLVGESLVGLDDLAPGGEPVGGLAGLCDDRGERVGPGCGAIEPGGVQTGVYFG